MHAHTNPKEPIKYESLWSPVLEFYSTYNVAHLQPIVRDLIANVLSAPSSKTNNVYIKYSTAKQAEVAVVCDKSKHILTEILEHEMC